MRAKVHYWRAPGLPAVELIAAHYLTQRFSRHWHAGFAVGIVTRNAQGFHADGRSWVIAPGDVIALNPGQVHDGYALQEAGWFSRMAYIPAADFACLAGGGAHERPQHLRFTRAVLHAPALWRTFLAFHKLAESHEDLSGHPITMRLFGALRTAMQPADPAPSTTRPLDDAAGLRIRLHLLAQQGDASVASLNADLELSRSATWRRVKSRLGMAPKPLLAHLRLISAKQMLANGSPVVEAALDCGYHDQSHLSHRFAAAYGMTPAQFRRGQMAVA